MFVGYSKIGEQLLVVYGLEFFNGFELYYYCVFHEDVKTEILGEYMTVVDYVDASLVLHVQALLSQFVAQGRFVDGL